MFIYSKWNGSTTYSHGENKRDFGTDYGICCWYTPQLNFRYNVSSQQYLESISVLYPTAMTRIGIFGSELLLEVLKQGKTTDFLFYLTSNLSITDITMKEARDSRNVYLISG